jgi:hypothetical protein
MITLMAMSKSIFAAATGLSLAFGATAAMGEPTIECMEAGGVASCISPASCESSCRALGYPQWNSRCDVSMRCCYCSWYGG